MRSEVESSFSGSEFEEESESMFTDVFIDGRRELVIDGGDFYRRVAKIKIARPCVVHDSDYLLHKLT